MLMNLDKVEKNLNRYKLLKESELNKSSYKPMVKFELFKETWNWEPRHKQKQFYLFFKIAHTGKTFAITNLLEEQGFRGYEFPINNDHYWDDNLFNYVYLDEFIGSSASIRDLNRWLENPTIHHLNVKGSSCWKKRKVPFFIGSNFDPYKAYKNSQLSYIDKIIARVQIIEVFSPTRYKIYNKEDIKKLREDAIKNKNWRNLDQNNYDEDLSLEDSHNYRRWDPYYKWIADEDRWESIDNNDSSNDDDSNDDSNNNHRDNYTNYFEPSDLNENDSFKDAYKKWDSFLKENIDFDHISTFDCTTFFQNKNVKSFEFINLIINNKKVENNKNKVENNNISFPNEYLKAKNNIVVFDIENISNSYTIADKQFYYKSTIGMIAFIHTKNGETIKNECWSIQRNKNLRFKDGENSITKWFKSTGINWWQKDEYLLVFEFMKYIRSLGPIFLLGFNSSMTKIFNHNKKSLKNTKDINKLNKHQKITVPFDITCLKYKYNDLKLNKNLEWVTLQIDSENQFQGYSKMFNNIYLLDVKYCLTEANILRKTDFVHFKADLSGWAEYYYCRENNINPSQYSPNDLKKIEEITKLDISYTMIDDQLDGKVKMKEIGKYCLRDVEITFNLFKKINYFAGIEESSIHYGLSPFDIIYRTKILDKYLVSKGYTQNSIFKGNYSYNIEGAYVQDPIPGFYDNVRSIDYASLYPSIIISKNISPDTYINYVLMENNNKNLLENYYEVCEAWVANDGSHNYKGYYVLYSKKEAKLGILPELLSRIKKKRLELKHKAREAKNNNNPLQYIYESQQNALKINMNGSYGLFIYC